MLTELYYHNRNMFHFTHKNLIIKHPMPPLNCWHNELENSFSKFLLNPSTDGCWSIWAFRALTDEAIHSRCYLRKLPTASTPLCAPSPHALSCQFIPRTASKVWKLLKPLKCRDLVTPKHLVSQTRTRIKVPTLILRIRAHFCQAVGKNSLQRVHGSTTQSTLTNPAGQHRKYNLLFHKMLAYKADHHLVRGTKLLPAQSKILCTSGESTHSHTAEKSTTEISWTHRKQGGH